MKGLSNGGHDEIEKLVLIMATQTGSFYKALNTSS